MRGEQIFIIEYKTAAGQLGYHTAYTSDDAEKLAQSTVMNGAQHATVYISVEHNTYRAKVTRTVVKDE